MTVSISNLQKYFRKWLVVLIILLGGIMAEDIINNEGSPAPIPAPVLNYSVLIKQGKAKAPALLNNLQNILTIDSKTKKISLVKINAKEDYQGAIRDFDMAMGIDQRKAEAFFLRGVVNIKIENYYDALEYLSRAIEIEPKYAEAYLFRGMLKDILDDVDGVQEDLTSAAELGNKTAKEFLVKKYTK